MTNNYPSANPGGEHTWLARQALKEWLDAAGIMGVTEVLLTLRPIEWFGEAAGVASACFLAISMESDTESRGAYTGPGDPGGKDIHYSVQLLIFHRGFDPDSWEDSQRDYDRIKDAIKDALRAQGRDLGRPEVFLQVGEWPVETGIVHTGGEAVNGDGGVVDRWGQLAFTITQYLPTFIPAA